MKNYILIQNEGEIEINSFELIGASTKRDDNTKIGFFGSGLKYSIAYMMRNKIDFKIFSGETEIIFSCKEEVFRGQIFERICINGNPTSYTTTMGATWTEDWFILRELYCNALDESSCQMVKSTSDLNAVSGKTRIYVEATESLRKVVDNWDVYFTDERTKLLTEENVYTTYLGEDNLRQNVDIYDKIVGSIYRKGIKVGEDSEMVYDYGFTSVTINEDRTAKSLGALSYCFTDLMSKFPSENYVCNILRTINSREYKSLQNTKANSKFSDKWIEFSKNYLLVIEEQCGKYSDEISKSRKEVFLIPRYFAKQIKQNYEEFQILGLGKSVDNIGFNVVEVTPKMNYLMNAVSADLKEMKYDIPYDITIVKFEDSAILGKADIKEKLIYLSDAVFDMGKREIAMTIMEEVEHINSGKQDETRAFQNHLISSWLKTMENQNGLFL